jgi:competence protein ComEC
MEDIMKQKSARQRIVITFLTIVFILNMFIPNLIVNAVPATKAIKISYIDVGQGDSELIQSNGQNMLIDTGTNESQNNLNAYLKNAGVKEINVLVLTHPHADHISGASMVINNYKVDKIIMPNVTDNTKTFRNVVQSMKNKNLKATNPIPGSSFKLGDATCNILAPNSGKYDNLNNYSVVIRIVYGKTSFIFDGDAEVQSEQEMLDKGYVVNTDVLKLGHHGSRTASSDAFLDKVRPKYAIISCGKGNDYGHPHDETIKKLLSRHITFYRTDVNGNIICTSDGNKLSFSTTGSSKPNNVITPDSPNGVTAAGGNATSTNNITKKETPSKNIKTGNSNADKIVYITKTGKDYHTDGCSSLRKSKIPIKLGEAVKEGYLPDSRCDAPILK